MKVKAVMKGYYGFIRRREGDVFEIKDESHFSKVWMREVDNRGRIIQRPGNEAPPVVKSYEEVIKPPRKEAGPLVPPSGEPPNTDNIDEALDNLEAEQKEERISRRNSRQKSVI